VSVPIVAVAVVVIGTSVVFDFHPERFESKSFGVLGLAVAASDLKPSHIAVMVDMTAASPKPTSCDRTRVSITVRVRREGQSARFSRTAWVLIQRPKEAMIELFEADETLRIVREFDAPFSSYTIIETALVPSTEQSSTLTIPMLVDRLARPRTVGSCYVPLPSLTTASTRSVPIVETLNFVGPAAGTVALRTEAGTVLREVTHPVPSDFEPAVARWRCTDARQNRRPEDLRTCDGTAVVEAHWRRPFEQIMLLVIGAFVALAAEYVILLVRGRRP
jgi:hypothetical protein